MTRYARYLRNRQFFKEIAKELFPRIDPSYGLNKAIALSTKEKSKWGGLKYYLYDDGTIRKHITTNSVYTGKYLGVASYKEYSTLFNSKKQQLEEMVETREKSEAFFANLNL